MMAELVKYLSFHHMGLAVKNDNEALVMLQALGYSIGDRIYDPLQNVYLRLCTSVNQPAVEIVQPGDNGKSPVDLILSKYNELIYHTCYETLDLCATLETIEQIGMRCILLSDRKPSVLFGGRHVSFYKICGWGIIEFLEKN